MSLQLFMFNLLYISRTVAAKIFSLFSIVLCILANSSVRVNQEVSTLTTLTT